MQPDGPRQGSDALEAPRFQAPSHVLRGRVVTPEMVHPDGVVVVVGERIAWVGPAADAPADVRVPGVVADLPTILPGLVDVHCHGGGGAGFPDATDHAQVRQAIAEHLAHGTTSLVASLVTAGRDRLLASTALLADLARAGELAGIHLEGPFLSPARCGAQSPDDMLPGDPGLVTELAATALGHLVTMTLAPEITGVLGPEQALDRLIQVGGLPSIGHTDASAETTDQAIAQARATLAAAGRPTARPTATHLFNGMRPIHHRDPGPVAAFLGAAARGDAVVELIADGVHLAPGTVRAVFDTVGAHSIVLVTDAMAAAGMPDGDYDLGPMSVQVRDGVARLTGDGAIAGGTAHLLDVVRWTVSIGVPLLDAVHAAATTPAAVLDRPEIGALVAGRRADLVLTNHDLQPRRVMQTGTWIA
jgi:N-acetylglucosamine-6-phosphate deacetylase